MTLMISTIIAGLGCPSLASLYTAALHVVGVAGRPGNLLYEVWASEQCADISGEWHEQGTDAQMALTQEEDARLHGLYNQEPNGGWYGIDGRKASSQPTFGFSVIWAGGVSATSWTGMYCHQPNWTLMFPWGSTWPSNPNGNLTVSLRKFLQRGILSYFCHGPVRD